MTSPEQHKKHAHLPRAKYGQFHRSEVAILGTTCVEVKLFVDQIRLLFPENVIAYADEYHTDDEQSSPPNSFSWLKHKAQIEVTTPLPDNRFQRIFSLAGADWVIANGNHFIAESQIIICNTDKEKSLRKRKDQLTNVVAIVLTGEQKEVPDYVAELAGNKPVFFMNELPNMKELLSLHFLKAAGLKGLIMAGGKSTRMGQDKPWLNFHGAPQVQLLADLMLSHNITPYVSCREDQQEAFESIGLNTISDRILNMGPLGGIASAFMHDPESAWLTVATDIPLFDASVLEELVSNRVASRFATSFVSPHDALPEPLLAIWEPKIYSTILQFVSLGYSCPRKVLLHTDVHLVHPNSPEKLTNVNTPADLEALRQNHFKA